AGHDITVYGDFGNADAGVGTAMDLRGSFTPGGGATDRTAFFGSEDNDTFTFNQTFLGGQTFAYGSNTPTPAGGTAPANDGANADGVDTLTVNGSAAADLYLLRKANYLIGRPGAQSPAFVALLHGTVAQAMSHTLDSHVERINYDVNVNGLLVSGLGGDDYF